METLRHDLAALIQVVPDDVSVEIFAGSKEDSARREFSQAVCELYIFARLKPRGEQEQVDGDAFLLCELPFTHSGLLGL